MSSSHITIQFGSTDISIRKQTPNIRKKGKSLLELPDDYTVIDIETTGLDAYYDDIIEIGCIRYRNNAPTEQFHTFLRPCQFFNEKEKSLIKKYRRLDVVGKATVDAVVDVQIKRIHE